MTVHYGGPLIPSPPACVMDSPVRVDAMRNIEGNRGSPQWSITAPPAQGRWGRKKDGWAVVVNHRSTGTRPVGANCEVRIFPPVNTLHASGQIQVALPASDGRANGRQETNHD